MTTSDQMRRLEALEAQARISELERQSDDPELRAWAAACAEELDMSVDAVIEESLEIALRIAEIGQAAFDREFAAELGVTVEDLHSEAWWAEQKRKWHEYQEWDRKRRAEMVWWRGGQMYRGGVPVT
jgi:hypothetical protein